MIFQPSTEYRATKHKINDSITCGSELIFIVFVDFIFPNKLKNNPEK